MEDRKKRIPKLYEAIMKIDDRTSEIIKSNSVLLMYITKVIHGMVHKGMIKPVDMLEENEEVLIIRLQKNKKSKIDMMLKKLSNLPSQVKALTDRSKIPRRRGGYL